MADKETAFQKSLRENPDLYDDMDCRPGPPNVSQEYMDSLMSDHVKKALAGRQQMLDKTKD